MAYLQVSIKELLTILIISVSQIFGKRRLLPETLAPFSMIPIS
jgi:hypothetical protein